jgi:hypothetical protein
MANRLLWMVERFLRRIGDDPGRVPVGAGNDGARGRGWLINSCLRILCSGGKEGSLKLEGQ